MTNEEKDLFKHLAYQLGIGALMCVCFVACCAIGEFLNRIY